MDLLHRDGKMTSDKKKWEFGVDGFTSSRRKIGIRYEFDLKVVLKGLG